MKMKKSGPIAGHALNVYVDPPLSSASHLGYSFGRPPSFGLYVSLRLRVQNAVPAQPCVGKLGISLVLLNFLHCNFRLWFKTP